METIFQTFDGVINTVSFLFSYDYSGVIVGLKIAAVPISLALVCGIIYGSMATKEVLRTLHTSEIPKLPLFEKPKNIDEWQRIRAQGNSADESVRKLSIIAADSLIEKILTLTGYPGQNLGERLKGIESSDLDSLNDIWEAHKVRNRIAHEADYRMSPEDSAAAIGRFEKALRELEYI